jgi:hypothetical protein
MNDTASPPAAGGVEASSGAAAPALPAAAPSLEASRDPGEPEVKTAAAPADAPRHRVIAYYFHNTQRCMTCNKIERLAEGALRETFSAELAGGELEWRVLNMEEAANAHFVDDYQLVASSLILVDTYDGQQLDWINMDKVWQYVHDDEAEFKQYVATQARRYLESSESRTESESESRSGSESESESESES